MKEFWSKKAQELTPYVAGEQPAIKNLIKLNTNENPYPPSPKAVEAMRNFDASKLALYPRTDGGVFRSAVAKYHGVDEKNVFCANGSDEVLGFAFQAFFDDNVCTPSVGYSFYPVWAELFDIEMKFVPMNDNFTLKLDEFCGNGAVIANPNAPTGIALNLDEIKQILTNTSGVVIIDEAYVDFGAQSALCLLSEHKNLLVTRTLSKAHSLAGIRMGYAIAHEHLVTALECVKDSFNSYPTDMLAQEISAQAILDTEYHRENCKKIIATREFVCSELKKLGFSILPSSANFVFAKHENRSAQDIYTALREQGILVRHFKTKGIDNFLRITIGLREDMEKLIKSIAN